MIPQRVAPDADDFAECELISRWRISNELGRKIFQVARTLPFEIQIISGWRSLEHQQELIDQGKGAPLERSTHVTCPATGADLWPTLAITDVVKAVFGENVVRAGLRWGGGSTVDPQTGIPWDWNHVDTGPRP